MAVTIDQFLQELITVSVATATRDMCASAVARTAGQTVAMLEAFSAGIGEADRQPIWDRMARDAQNAVANSYVQTRRRGGPAGYRQTATRPGNVRYSGGRMLAAIRDDRFVEVGRDSIRFANINVLDQHAKQWARLNFGTAPISGGVVDVSTIRWSNLVVASIGASGAPRPRFKVPQSGEGFWTETGEFHPVSENGGPEPTDFVMKAKWSKGIQARNFLGAGTRRMAADLPDAMREMYVKAYKNAETRGAMAAAGIRVVKPTSIPKAVITNTPRSQRIR